MENQLFRQKSMERISSPEQLQDYMRVTNPGIWMVLAAVIALLAGLIICSIAGRLETTLEAKAMADDGQVTVTLSPSQGVTVEAGMVMRVAGKEAPIDYVYENDKGRYVAVASMDVPEGQHDAVIVKESIAPISFLLND